MKLKLFALRERLRASLWFIPTMCVVATFWLAALTISIDHAIDPGRGGWFLYRDAADGARGLLTTIAASMITFTGLVFSITMLVLQIASGQFSPRVLRTFLRDRTSQIVLGVFVATFTYALLVLREIQSAREAEPESGFVPALSVWIAFLLMLLSIGVFIHYIHHMAQSIRAVSVIVRVGNETRDAIARLYPEAGVEPPDSLTPPVATPDRTILSPGPPGVVTAIDEAELLALACRHDLVVRVTPMVGDFVPEGAPLLQVWGDAHALDREALDSCVSFAPERTMLQDAAFGFRQLVDIAERALSPAINDPTTAVQALDQIHDLLRRLSDAPFPSPLRLDDGGQLRVVLPRPDWDDYVMLALDEIRQYGRQSIQVARRLRALLLDVRTVALPERAAILDRELALLDAGIDRGFAAGDRLVAHQASPQGHGPN